MALTTTDTTHASTGDGKRGRGRWLRHLFRGRHTDTSTGTETSRDVVLASAALVTDKQIKRAVSRKSWQSELWGYFDTIGEMRYSVRWLASAASRCTLFIGQYTEEGAEPVPLPTQDLDTLPCQLLNDLYYGPIGQSEMLRRIALHLSVPGESYLIGLDPDPEQGITEPTWYVASNEEISASGNKVTLIRPETGEPVELRADNSTVIRLWQPHPRNAWEADSAVRATIPVLREVQGLSDHISASVDSRLAGAGIFVIPEGASMPRPASADASGVNEDPDEGDIMGALTTAMLTSIEDRDAASAVVPIVIQVPDESIAKFQHISFATPLSEKVAEMRAAALERFASGADIPREVVTGSGGTNHWNAWQIEESSIKLHVEPLMAAICDALTRQYLWPALRAHNIANPESWVIWYNPSELSQRPNKSAEATALWDKGLLNDGATRRENGFADDDAPSPEEHRRWLQEKLLLSQGPQSLAGGTAAENSTQDAYEHSPPELVAAAIQPASPGVDRWWVAAVEQAVLRVMELAGNRWLGKQPKKLKGYESPLRAVARWELHTHITPAPTGEIITDLLKDSLDAARVTFASDPCVVEQVEAYCRHLLSTRTPHSRLLLTGWLVEHGCRPGTLALPAA